MSIERRVQVYPTTIRSLGVGMCSAWAKVSNMPPEAVAEEGRRVGCWNCKSICSELASDMQWARKDWMWGYTAYYNRVSGCLFIGFNCGSCFTNRNHGLRIARYNMHA